MLPRVERSAMTKILRGALTSAAAAAALAMPLAAPAATTSSAQPQSYTMQTRIVDQYHAGEYDGVLTLTINPDGIVQGSYRDDNGRPTAVTGGVDGQNIWLDIGWRRPLHLTGTFRSGVLRATAALPGPDVYQLESTSVKRTG